MSRRLTDEIARITIRLKALMTILSQENHRIDRLEPACPHHQRVDKATRHLKPLTPVQPPQSTSRFGRAWEDTFAASWNQVLRNSNPWSTIGPANRWRWRWRRPFHFEGRLDNTPVLETIHKDQLLLLLPQIPPNTATERTTFEMSGPQTLSGQRRISFEINADEYEILGVVGQGGYGVVCSAEHRASGMMVAIKKISPFGHSMLCVRTLREMKMLLHFRHENIISLLGIQKPQSYEKFNDVYLIQELMETDMHRVIRTQDLSDDHCQYFIYQTLRGLKAIHSAGILHRDLKPSNLLLNANCDLKICDFGLARLTASIEDQQGFMTEYVATRWYRAPEVMLSFKQYTKAIDLWSVGCILAEMLSGKPLFPGKDYHHQLSLILDVLGTPTSEDRDRIKSNRAQKYIKSLPFKEKKPWGPMFPSASELSLDLLERLLTFDPTKRIGVEEALEHTYLEPYHDPQDEPTATRIPEEHFDFDKNQESLSKEELKRLIYEEAMR
ncbi:hypothetical protein Q7P37_009881 [Cladosporium fusiforme]